MAARPSLTVIARNATADLAACLSSAAGVVDEMIVVACLGEPGDPRPTKFSGGGAYTLEVFKREKPKAADPATGGPI
jgi:hypothetical protein